MDTNTGHPETLLEAIRYFADPDTAIRYVAALRWPDGAFCPRCGEMEPRFLKTRRLWKCRGCKKQFSVKVGTIMEDSAISLDKWLCAFWMIANCKNGVSSYEIHRTLGITQKSAWFLLHRIRTAMQTQTFEKMIGTVEVDESFFGGKVSNMSNKKRRELGGQGPKGKAIVMGILNRGGDVRAKVVPNTKKDTLLPTVHEHVEPGSKVYTDSAWSYTSLRDTFQHESVNHFWDEYVRGEVHTNGIENFWSCLKRGVKGTYVSVEPFHLSRYVDEQVFRFNNRHANDAERFDKVLGMMTAKRMTYRALITEQPEFR